MDQRGSNGMRRPIRNKRCNRKNLTEERKPPKRLFTPEIKRFLKDWLVRRRDNPYPNRDEKKLLAVETGLTYIQICNWFANWRRKLKNNNSSSSSSNNNNNNININNMNNNGDSRRKTWANLIKSYNDRARGNVEHFSICSDDSIWHEEQEEPTEEDDKKVKTVDRNRNYLNKYKSHIMDKYLRDCRSGVPNDDDDNNVNVLFMNNHGREELDAAEALTTLAYCFNN